MIKATWYWSMHAASSQKKSDANKFKKTITLIELGLLRPDAFLRNF